MKAIRFHKFGGPDVLVYEDAPKPAPGPYDVVVQLKAAALNHLDLFIRRGAREKNIPLPHISGSDGAGIVAEVGALVFHLKPGDRVAISPGIGCGKCSFCLGGRENFCTKFHVLGNQEDGTFAEFIKLPARNVLPISDSMSFEDAAAFTLVSLTAWHMLMTLARLKSGETVLIHGAGSGVGSAAIQIAKLFDAHVIATAGSEEKLAKAKELGADQVINYKEKDFVKEVRALTGKAGVDVVFEHIGGEVFEKSITIMKKGGRLVTCGTTTDGIAKSDVRYIFSRQLTIHGSFMGTKEELVKALGYFQLGQLRAVIDSVFPLAQTADAQRRMESRENFGKIVLKI